MSLLRIALCLLLCSVGCIYQIYHISDLFFVYSTTTKVSISRQTDSFVPTLVVCTNFSNFLEPPVDDFLQFRITTPFDQWFDRTPPTRYLIGRGSYFANASSWIITYNKTEADLLFLVGKLFKRTEVCYTINREEPFRFNYRQATSTSGDPILVTFTFNSTLIMKETSLDFFIHSADSSFHGISNSLAAVHLSRNPVTYSIYLKKVILTYAEYQSWLLPAPYDSNCYDYRPEYKTERHCYDQCHLELSVKLQDRIPMSVIKDRRIKSMMYGKQIDMTVEAKKILSDIKRNCTTKCQKVQCNNDDFVPILIHAVPNLELEVALQASPDPLFRTIYEPKIYTIDFATYILSCIGFWYGLSFYQAVGMGLLKLTNLTSLPDNPRKRMGGKVSYVRNSSSVQSSWDRFHKKSLRSRVERLERLIHEMTKI